MGKEQVFSLQFQQDATSLATLIVLLILGIVLTVMMKKSSINKQKKISDKVKAEKKKKSLIKKLEKYIEASEAEDPWGERHYRLNLLDAKYILELIKD